jgi:hypothetical protein
MPMPEFAARIPRKSASCHWPNASVAPPATSRIRLKTVTTLARTMLQVDRLVGGGPGGGFAARRREASASVRPRCSRSALAVAVRPATLAHGRSKRIRGGDGYDR